MPQLIAEDAQSQTYLTDQGQTVTVARPFGEQFGAPPPAPPAPDNGILPPDFSAAPPAPAPELLPPGQPEAPPAGEVLPPDALRQAPGLGVPQLAPPAAPPEVVPGPAPAPEPPPSIFPDAVPKTSVQAAQMGLGGLQQESDARQQAAQAESLGAEQTAQAYDANEARLADEQRQREQYAAYRAKEEAFLTAEKTKLIDRFANHKVDRGRLFHEMSTGDHVMAGVGMALADLGRALTGRQEASNPALDLILGRMDQDVQLQMADRERLGTLINLKTDQIADFRSVSQSRLGEYNTRMAGHLARLERDVAKIAARTQSQTVKSNAEAFTAQIRQKGADLLGGAVRADQAALEQRRTRQQAAGAQAAAQREERAQFQAKTGTIFNPKTGRYEPDPAAAQQPLSIDDRYKQTQIDKNNREAEQADRGATVVDSTGKVLGRARRGEQGAKDLSAEVKYNEVFRTTMARMADAVQRHKRVFKGPGSSRWSSEARTEIETMRVDLANQLAKIRDPQSVNRDAEITAALKEIPDLDGWTSSANPMVKYRTLVKTSDDRLDKSLAIELENFDSKASPTRRYQAMDRASQEPVDTDKREDLVKELTVPLAKDLDPEVRASAITGLGRKLDALGDRDEGLTRPEIEAIKTALDQRRAEGDLSEREYVQLTSSLVGNALVRQREAPSLLGTVPPAGTPQAELELYYGVK